MTNHKKYVRIDENFKKASEYSMNKNDEMEQLLNMIYSYLDFRNPSNKPISKKQLVLCLKQFFKEKYQGIEKLEFYQSYLEELLGKKRTKGTQSSIKKNELLIARMFDCCFSNTEIGEYFSYAYTQLLYFCNATKLNNRVAKKLRMTYMEIRNKTTDLLTWEKEFLVFYYTCFMGSIKKNDLKEVIFLIKLVEEYNKDLKEKSDILKLRMARSLFEKSNLFLYK